MLSQTTYKRLFDWLTVLIVVPGNARVWVFVAGKFVLEVGKAEAGQLGELDAGGQVGHARLARQIQTRKSS